MAIDSMNKAIHAAVRRDLARLDAALAAVSADDRARAADLDRAWGQLNDQLRHHHEQEDEILFPALGRLGVDQALIDTLEVEHQAMAAALDEVDRSIRTFATSGTAADAAVAGQAVRRCTAVVNQHLDHEEAELEPLVRPHLESEEWQGAMRLIRKQSPRRAGWFFAWLGDGASDEARHYVDSEVPRPVQMVLGKGFGRGYHRTIAPVWR